MPYSLAASRGLFKRASMRMSMRAKIAMTAALITSLNVSTMVFYSAQNQFLAAEQNGYLVAEAAASNAAALITMRLSLAMGAAQSNAHAILALHSSGQATRERVNAILRNSLEAHPELVGMYTGWEPNAFDSQDAKFAGNKAVGSNQDGRYMPYFEWSNGRVNLSPLMGYEQYGPGDYYLLPRDSGRAELIDPYAYPVGGKTIMMTSLVQPLMRNGKFAGISGVDIDLGTLQEELIKIKPMGVGTVYLYSTSRRVVSSPNLETIGNVVSETDVSPDQWVTVTSGKRAQYVAANEVHHFLIPVKMQAFDKPWVLDVRIPQSTILAQATQARSGAIVIGLLFLLLDVVLIGWVVLRQLRPLHDFNAVMEGAGGDLSANANTLRLPVERNDEVGMLARSFSALRSRLVDSFATLENRVQERTASLEQALHSLEKAQNEIIQTEKLASLGRIVAGVAHELNTPIGNAVTVTSTIELELTQLKADAELGSLKRSALTSFLDRTAEGLDLAMRNLKRAASLITDFKQVAVDQTSDQRRNFDLAEVTTEVVNMLQPTVRRSGCNIHLELLSDVECEGYPGRYGQVLTNLVMNALTHAFEPGLNGTITVRTELVDDAHVRLTVTDDGVGMTEEVRTRIFDPFFTTKMGRGGTGLGMHIVHSIITQVMGGTVTVRSEPGQGAQIQMVFRRFLE